MQKIYIDCTHTYYSGLNTGIQRVVRNIVKKSSFINDTNINIVPVILYNDNYIEINELPVVSYTKKKINIKNYLKKLYVKIRNIISIIPFFKKILYSPSLTTYLNRSYDLIAFNYLKKPKNNKKAFFKDKDILILLDATWLDSNFKLLEELKHKKVFLISIVYDIIPITHSRYCSDDLSRAYSLWLNKIYPLADAFISISKTVEKELMTFMQNNHKDINKKFFDHFLLGVDFKDIQYTPNTLDDKYKNIFIKDKTYITISTLEPRKNHEYILDVFEKLWDSGIDVTYVIIGRLGWKIDKLLKRIKNHKELDKRLFLFNHIDDNALIYAYKNSKAMIFASYAEGFGLPIIESLHYNLQVLASDIPIHREVGHSYVTYFDLAKKETLIKIIKENNFNKDLNKFKYIDWEESTKQLITKSLKVMKNNEA